MFVPIIKKIVFDNKNPCRVTVLKNIDGHRWWQCENCVPSITQPTNDIKINSNGDKYHNYRFSQLLFNVVFFNNLNLSSVHKFTSWSTPTQHVFIYFIDDDESVVVPLLPTGDHNVMFTLFEQQYPILKIVSNHG